MGRALFRFYAELNDFLPPEWSQQAFPHAFTGEPTVKDRIEALGVPHPEVDLILVNGEPAGFDYRLQDDDRVSVYPRFHTLEVEAVSRVRPEVQPEPRFVLDVHLGRLATGLRLLGFDTRFGPDFDDAELARVAITEGRILLSRDRGLLKRGGVVYGYCPRSADPSEQVREVLRHFELHHAVEPFSRCLRCNDHLEPVAKAAVLDRLEPLTAEHYDEFFRCRGCDQIYWKGSHYEAMLRSLERAIEKQAA
jgi:uncharacterized protein with PIN domain